MIRATAPVRICDFGGWTDTWFGGPGRVVHLGVAPGVTVTIRPTVGDAGRVVIDLPSFGDRYEIVPGEPRPPRHSLVEAAIDTYPPPSHGPAIEITVESEVPPGASTGTSAAVAVALIGALSAATPKPLTGLDVAYAAHRLEVEILGLESGIQDQLCAALGGINYIAIDTYPNAHVQPLPAWDELGGCLTLVYLGRPHDSSAVHRRVIADASKNTGAFDRLRQAAEMARAAITGRDLEALAEAIRANTEAQAALHPAVIGPTARQLIETARSDGVTGWKVNGAGGDGGSVTLLSPDHDQARRMQRQLEGVLPIRLNRLGLEIDGQAVSTDTS